MDNESNPQDTAAITPVSVDAQLPVYFDATENPFRLVIDPEMRANMREALIKLIDCHDEELARYVAQEKLSLDSYKEYVELFARSLRECMDSPEGIGYLLKSCGFDVPSDQINLQPDWRWKKS